MSTHKVQNIHQEISSSSRSYLDELVHNGARKMLQSALEEEVESYLLKHANHKDAAGHQLVVRNGSMPERKILTGAGALEIKQPRINDKRSEEKFSSAILPPYLRKSPSIETLFLLFTSKEFQLTIFLLR
jgi:putative transposase